MTLDEPHILVVDDDKRLRDLLRKYLMDNGFRVTVAMEAEDARARLQSMEYDLIVMDRMMPGEDGLALTRSIREGRRRFREYRYAIARRSRHRAR